MLNNWAIILYHHSLPWLLQKELSNEPSLDRNSPAQNWPNQSMIGPSCSKSKSYFNLHSSCRRLHSELPATRKMNLLFSWWVYSCVKLNFICLFSCLFFLFVATFFGKLALFVLVCCSREKEPKISPISKLAQNLPKSDKHTKQMSIPPFWGDPIFPAEIKPNKQELKALVTTKFWRSARFHVAEQPSVGRGSI